MVKVFAHPIPPFRRFPPADGIVQGNCYEVLYERLNDINRGFEEEVHDIVWACTVKRQYYTPSFYYGPTRGGLGDDISNPHFRTMSPNGTPAPPFLNGRAMDCTVGNGFQDFPLPMALGSHNVRPMQNGRPDEFSYERTSLAEIDSAEEIAFRATDESSGIPEDAILTGEAGVNYGFRWAGWTLLSTNVWERMIESWWDYNDDENSHIVGSMPSRLFGWERVSAIDSGLPEGTQMAGAISGLAAEITTGLGTRDGWFEILERVFSESDQDWRDVFTETSALAFNSFSVYCGFDPVLELVTIPFARPGLPTNGDDIQGVSIVEPRRYFQFRFDTEAAPRLYNPNATGTNSCPSKLNVTQVFPAIFEMPLSLGHGLLFPCAMMQVADYRATAGGHLVTENLGTHNEPQLISSQPTTPSSAPQRAIFSTEEIIGAMSGPQLFGKQAVDGTGGMRWYEIAGSYEDGDKPCVGNPFVFEELQQAQFQPYWPRADEKSAITDAVAKKMRDYGDAYFLTTSSTFEPYEPDKFIPNAGL